VPSVTGGDRIYLIRDGHVVGDAAITDTDMIARLLALEARPVSRATGLTVTALEELTLIEHWFRTRSEEQLRTAPTLRELLR